MKQITYSPSADKTLRKMPANTAKRIMSKVKAYAVDPVSQVNNVTALKGMDGAIRLRVGDWRVVMVDGVAIYVSKIAARGSVY